MIKPTPTQHQIASFSCALFGAAVGALIGSDLPSDIGDVRYGAAGLGAIVGLLFYLPLFMLALHVATPMIRPPSRFSDQEKRDEYEWAVNITAVILMIIFGLTGFGFLFYELLIDGHPRPGSAAMAVVLASAFAGSFAIGKIKTQ